MEMWLILVAVAWLAYANGANDNFKGVATLFGSGLTNYRGALTWATATTLAGSLASIALAGGLVATFGGQGIVPATVVQAPHFSMAVVFGAAATVMLATRFGLPISTTHGLIGGLAGAGAAAAGTDVNFAVLGERALVPLIASPLLALVAAAILYLLARRGSAALGVRREDCVCAGEEVTLSAGEAIVATSRMTISIDAPPACESRYTTRLFGFELAWLLDGLHYLSAGAVGFARGLNDTPKIAAVLLTTGSLGRPAALSAVAVAVALGGLLSARRVAHTLAHRVTAMSPGQGFTANLITAALVTSASVHGLPVSTTHVSVGSLAGVGTVTAQARWLVLVRIGAAWLVTLPLAAVIAAVLYSVLGRLL